MRFRGEPGARLETGDVERRRLGGALAASVLIHLALVISFGESGGWREPQSRIPDLVVRIQESASSIPQTRPARPAATPTLHAATTPRNDAGPPRAAAAILGAPPLLAGSEQPVLTTTGESARVVVTAAASALPRVTQPLPPAAVPEELAQRIGEWIGNLPSAPSDRGELSWQQNGQTYTAVLKRRAQGMATDLERYDVEIVTPSDTGRWATGLTFRRLSFSHFTQFVDRWDRNIQLHDDEIAGRFHSNSPIVIGYDRQAAPRFLGKVTTAGKGFRTANTLGRRRHEDIFLAGLETDVGRIELPRKPEPFAVPVVAESGGHHRRFERDSRIQFQADGSYRWSELRGRDDWRLEPPAESPVYLSAMPGAELRVSGTVRGQVLVHSPERIVIEGDLRYARDPRSDPEAGDLLGLVSEGRVEIAPPHTTGRGDLDIDAAIFALGRFVVSHTDAPRAGTLRIYGSLTAGSLSETEPRYATRIDFDPRLETRRPPGFPMAPRFELEATDAAWRLED